MPRYLLIDTTVDTVETGARQGIGADTPLAAVEAVAPALTLEEHSFVVLDLDAATYVEVKPDVSLQVSEVQPPTE